MSRQVNIFFEKEIYHLLHSDQHNPKIKQHTVERLQEFVGDTSEETRRLLLDIELNNKAVFYLFSQKMNALLNDIQFIQNRIQLLSDTQPKSVAQAIEPADPKTKQKPGL